jgi:SAM-dependent methyltransferase
MMSQDMVTPSTDVERYPARTRYRGQIARDYVRRRAATPKWHREQVFMEALIDTLPPGSLVLDMPVGTGRFLRSYARAGHRVCGIDISADMLRESRGNGPVRPSGFQLIQGEAEGLPLRDASVDVVVCTRFMNWVPAARLERVLGELVRVSRDGVVIEIRVVRRLGFGAMVARLTRPARWYPPDRLVRRLRTSVGAAWAAVRGRRSGYVTHDEDHVARTLAALPVRIDGVTTLGRRLRYARREAHELRVYRLRRIMGTS